MLSYTFFTNALIASLLTGIITGIIGSFVVVRRMVFVSGGITHSSFAGLGLGYYLGQSPVLFAMMAAVLSGIGVEALSQRGKVREDSAIAAIWSLGMAIGILFIHLTPGYTPGLNSFLFGNILLTTRAELVVLGIYMALTLALVCIFYTPLLYVSFDPVYAKIRGLPVALYQYAMIVWVSVGIVLSLRAMGIMMLMSLLTLPQMTLNLFTSNLRRMMVGACLLSVGGLLLSLWVSYSINLPTGAVSVFIFALIFLVCKLFKR